MAASWEIDDLISMQRMCYRHLAGLLREVPDDQMEARAGDEGYSVKGLVRHACIADMHYLNTIDGGSRQAPEPAPDKAALLELLQRSEAEMIGWLEDMSPDLLCAKRTLAWREEEATCLFILIHTIRHKHYHTGQLQSILFILQSEQ